MEYVVLATTTVTWSWSLLEAICG